MVASASQLLQKGCTTTSEANLIVLCSCRQLASASPRRSIKWIIQEMLSGLGFQGDTTLDTEDQLIDKLRKYLKEKRYVHCACVSWKIMFFHSNPQGLHNAKQSINS